MDTRQARMAWECLWKQRKREFHYRNILEIVNQTSVVIAKARVLEVGCGRGATLLEFAKRGAVVTGVDYAESALALCRNLQAKWFQEGSVRLAQFVQADARHLPFEKGTFDVVYSVGLVEHFEDPGPILAEQCRVLRDGGYCVVQVPQKYSVYTVLKKILIACNRWPYGVWETQFSQNGLRIVVAKAGLSADFAYGYGSFARAVLRHFLFPALDHGAGGWHRGDRGFLAKLKTNVSLDVGILARKTETRASAFG